MPAFTITLNNFPATASMIYGPGGLFSNGLLTIRDPFIDTTGRVWTHTDGKVVTYANVDNDTITLSSLNSEYGSPAPAGIAQISGSFVFNIIQVQNVNTIVVIDNSTATALAPVNNFSYPIESTAPAGFQSATFNAFTNATNFTASFIQPQAATATARSQSYARIILSNLDPATGDVYAIRTSYKPGSAYGNFRDLGLTVLEQQEQLITGSQPTAINPVIGATDPSTGFFINTDDITNSWTSSIVGTGIVQDPLGALLYDPTYVMGAVRIGFDTGTTFSTSNGVIFKLREDSGHMPTLSQNTDYVLTLRHYVSGSPAGVSTLGTGHMAVFISGSTITNTGITTPINYQLPTLTDPIINGPYGTLLGIISTNDTTGTYPNNPVSLNVPYTDTAFTFTATENKPVSIYFLIRGGTWHLADISLRSDTQTGFTPNYARIDLRVPSEHLNIPLTYKFEYVNYLGFPAEYSTILYNITMSGDNLYIQGNNNILTGSIYAGSSVPSGIQISGLLQQGVLTG
jgi:hypothetical protein